MEAFPRLYSLALSQDVLVGDLCHREEEEVTWRFGWRRKLFEWEKEFVNELLVRLEGVVMVLERIRGSGNRIKRVCSLLSLAIYYF